jgi:transcriptional regulator with XRE-family HTH domain
MLGGREDRPARTPEVDVGRRIREAREALGLSQHELADRIGVSQRAVSYVEKRSWVKQSTLKRYGDALERPLPYFLRSFGGHAAGSPLTRQEVIEQAFGVVCRDAEFGFGARPGEELSLEARKDIVRLYERYKGISLLSPECD